MDREAMKQHLVRRAEGYEAALKIITAERAASTAEQRMEDLALLRRTAFATGRTESPASPTLARENWIKLKQAWLERTTGR
ncbi:MAG: hypothetical protein ACR2IE_14805 [Candidatus Sumerlaeaceae bacterium]